MLTCANLIMGALFPVYLGDYCIFIFCSICVVMLFLWKLIHTYGLVDKIVDW